ncbi:cation efflux family protein [Salinisphaera sp. C84B14]|uniref:efflux RND transporter periplasmic adaptor subunit n=1 Tax=Salinisphaera sp. C84B14 TaxID=1304155 RepID=UPI00333EAEA4
MNNRLFRQIAIAGSVVLLLSQAACNGAPADNDGRTQGGAQVHASGPHAEHDPHEGGDHDRPDDTQHDPNRVELNAEQREALDIRVAPAGGTDPGAAIQAPATVEFDADRVARVGPRLQAKVVSVAVDLGARVEAGDTLAVLDSVALGKEKAAYLTATARYRTRQAAYARDRNLAADQIVSESDLAETRAAYEQARAERRAERAELRLYGLDKAAIDAIDDSADVPLSRMTLIAPRAGVVARRDLVAGQTLNANETPIHIVDNTRMWLMIDAAEQALSYLEEGQSVRFDVRPFPDARFTGRVDWISPRLDAQTRTVQVRAIVDNPDGLLRAGMFATATIAAGQGDAPDSIASGSRHTQVPIDAVQQIGARQGVFVPGEGEGVFVFTPVTTGREGSGQVEISSGVSVGQPLVVAGAFDLKAALTAAGRSATHSH